MKYALLLLKIEKCLHSHCMGGPLHTYQLPASLAPNGSKHNTENIAGYHDNAATNYAWPI